MEPSKKTFCLFLATDCIYNHVFQLFGDEIPNGDNSKITGDLFDYFNIVAVLFQKLIVKMVFCLIFFVEVETFLQSEESAPCVNK